VEGEVRKSVWTDRIAVFTGFQDQPERKGEKDMKKAEGGGSEYTQASGYDINEAVGVDD
jgi:hypothetical protein